MGSSRGHLPLHNLAEPGKCQLWLVFGRAVEEVLQLLPGHIELQTLKKIAELVQFEVSFLLLIKQLENKS